MSLKVIGTVALFDSMYMSLLLVIHLNDIAVSYNFRNISICVAHNVTSRDLQSFNFVTNNDN